MDLFKHHEFLKCRQIYFSLIKLENEVAFAFYNIIKKRCVDGIWPSGWSAFFAEAHGFECLFLLSTG